MPDPPLRVVRFSGTALTAGIESWKISRHAGRGVAEAATTAGAAAGRVSVKSVESHREHIKAKLNLESGGALARRPVEWVETDEVST